MKRVVSVSLGSSQRDKVVEAEFLGERFRIERIGTDGDLERAVRLIGELDGQVDAIGLGGIDLYLIAAGRRYAVRDAVKMARAARRTPVVDGSGLKHTLERRLLRWLNDTGALPLRGKRVLLLSGVDRFGMAELLPELGAQVIYGDMIFALNMPLAIRSLRTLRAVARTLLPVICRLPFKMIYPTGAKQEVSTPKYERYFKWADVIAGDFHFLRRYMPARLDGKAIITNTLTEGDVALLRERGAALLISSTPELDGRSFGTNVMEAILVAASGDPNPDYDALLDRFHWQPRVIDLSQPVAAGTSMP